MTPAFGERPDFDNGRLQVMALTGSEAVAGAGSASWIDVDADDPSTYRPEGSTSFVRGEGLWYHDRIVYWVASTFSQIFAYDTRTDTQEILHDPAVVGSQMNDADNLCVHPMTGDLYITEDAPQSIGIEVLIITAPDADGARTVAPVIRAAAGQHAGSEFTGPVFDPSGTRFYFASQRMTSPDDATNVAAGVIYEVTGPFVRATQQPAPSEPAPSEPQPTGEDPAPAPSEAPTSGGATLPATGGDDVLGWAGLGVGAIGWLAARRARATGPSETAPEPQ